MEIEGMEEGLLKIGGENRENSEKRREEEKIERKVERIDGERKKKIGIER